MNPIETDLINYSRLGQAQTFYNALGYVNLDTPWIVSPQAITATLPADAKLIQTNLGSLIGSGEQSFIQLMLDGRLEPGKWQTTTACFRDDSELTERNRRHFMKTELIWYMPPAESEDLNNAYRAVVNDALNCFFNISDCDTFDAVPTAEGYDIMYNGIELGSYGVRQMGEHIWVYGTGLAEPRFSQAMRSRNATPKDAVTEEPVAQETNWRTEGLGTSGTGPL